MKRRFLCVAACALPLIAGAGQPSVNQGVRLLKKGDFDAASDVLGQVKGVDPALVQYNLGNALYAKGEFAQANEAFEKAQYATDEQVRRYAEYNAGNSLLTDLVENGSALDTAKKLEAATQATDHFKKAVKLDPSDLAAKQNFEQAKRIQDQLEEQKKQEEEQQKQDQENQENDDQDQDDQDQEPGDDQQSDDQKNQDQQDSDQQQDSDSEQDQDSDQDSEDQQQDQELQEDEQNPEQQAQPEPQPQNAEEMTEQEAQQVMDAMKQDEQDKRPTIMYGRPQQVEKDW